MEVADVRALRIRKHDADREDIMSNELERVMTMSMENRNILDVALLCSYLGVNNRLKKMGADHVMCNIRVGQPVDKLCVCVCERERERESIQL